MPLGVLVQLSREGGGKANFTVGEGLYRLRSEAGACSARPAGYRKGVAVWIDVVPGTFAGDASEQVEQEK